MAWRPIRTSTTTEVPAEVGGRAGHAVLLGLLDLPVGPLWPLLFAATVALLIGATLTSIFFGWFVPKSTKLDGLGMNEGMLFFYVNAMLRYVVPPVMMIALVLGLMER